MSLNQLVQRSTPLQRAWLSGFLAGLDAAQGGVPQIAAAAARSGTAPACPLTILYGSESGNTEALAHEGQEAGSEAELRCCASSTWRMPDLAHDRQVEEPHRLYFDLGRGRPAAACRGFPQGVDGRRLRRASKASASPCSRSATPPTSTSARQVSRSMRASRRLVARASPTARISISISPSRLKPGPTRRSK